MNQVEQEMAWVVATLQGDREAFASLVDAYKRPVYNLCYRMLGTSMEAEDASQEVFVKIHRRLHTYDANRKLSSWVLSIASHHCIDRLRRRRLKTVDIEEMPPWAPLVSSAPQPEQQLLVDEREARIQGMLDHLEPGYRLPLVLHYWSGLSYEEISETTGLTVSAIKSRLHRARRKLAAVMAEEAPDLIPETQSS
ncbi:MAG: sigma-70 family RNA polymerase sigma factor [Anaerolineales bacterium]|nr:sigma-70 family RNA polymerase sigma factor [Anaerolineales bacterium]MCB9128986.1 sigma-70 family RNA polymerase sigma factor [Ardenticatenales bacterium]